MNFALLLLAQQFELGLYEDALNSSENLAQLPNTVMAECFAFWNEHVPRLFWNA